MYIEPESAQHRRHTPWRDPRQLRSKRLQGYPSHSLSSALESASENAIASGESIVGQLASTAKRFTQSPTLASTTAPREMEYLASAGDNHHATAPDAWYGIGDSQDRSAKPTESILTGDVGAAELNRIQVALGEMVSQPMQVWNLEPLTQQTQYVIQHGATPVERGQARLLLERIQEFEILARKSGYAVSVLPASASSAIAPIQSEQVAGASYPQSAALGGRDPNFEATGWMVPVHAASAEQPSHAITNDAGQIIAYVSGLPGMNLDRYVNQPVGLNGLRGYLPHLQANHIQVQQIVRLR